MSKVEYYEVGGSIRDSILGIESNDIDYTVIAASYESMKEDILKRGYQIFLETPQYYTIRAKRNDGKVADFVWARKEGPYSDGRHPDWVQPGTLLDDLERRDFTMNALAKCEDGIIIDPFCGIGDLNDKVIRCVGNTQKRFEEDRLRLLRAIRFSITKSMKLSLEIDEYIRTINKHYFDNISIERIREELKKCFEYDTSLALYIFGHKYYWSLYPIWKNAIWLKPTIEKR